MGADVPAVSHTQVDLLGGVVLSVFPRDVPIRGPNTVALKEVEEVFPPSLHTSHMIRVSLWRGSLSPRGVRSRIGPNILPG